MTLPLELDAPAPLVLSFDMVILMRSLEEIKETLMSLIGVSDVSIVEEGPLPFREGNPKVLVNLDQEPLP